MMDFVSFIFTGIIISINFNECTKFAKYKLPNSSQICILNIISDIGSLITFLVGFNSLHKWLTGTELLPQIHSK